MAVQKRIPRSAHAAFCPNAPLIVTGSAQGSVDGDFGGSPALEIFSLDLPRAGLDLPAVAKPVEVPDSLVSLAWGTFGIATGRSKFGIIGGALGNGDVCLWDPNAIVGKQGAASCIHTWKPSADSVTTCVSFSSLAPNVMAAGTSSGEVLIYDITNPTAPVTGKGEATLSQYNPDQRRSGTAQALSVQFNNQTERIVAIGYSNGHTHVYDYHNQRIVFDFKDDNSARRTGCLAWSPVSATHLILGSEDDRSPTLQFWDLRKGSAPTLEFVGHSRGVTDIAWCPQDSGVMVSCAKDHRTIVWDTSTGETLGGLPSHEQPAFRVAWSTLSPGVFAACRMNGAVELSNFVGTASVTEAVHDPATGTKVAHQFSKPLPRAPQWMRKRCSARFGWGGKLATVGTGGAGASVVSISAVMDGETLQEHSAQFEAAIAGDLRSYCEQKASAGDSNEAQTWGFIQVLFDGENAKSSLLQKLGFTPKDVQLPPAQSIGDQVEAAAAHLHEAAMVSAADAAQDEDFFDRPTAPAGGNDFFDSVGSPKHDGGGNNTHDLLSESTGGRTAALTGHDAVEEDGEGEADVQKALFVGEHDRAVDVCLRKDRMSDALVIAHVSGDVELMRRTVQQYMQACPRPYMRVVDAQLKENYDTLVKARPVGVWMETLAILVTYTHLETFTRLCTMLAKRLSSSGMVHAATLCYICAGDVDAAVLLWMQQCQGSAMSVADLQSVLEKSIALGRAAQHDKASAALSDLISNYSLRLISLGCARSAMTYLEMLPGEATTAAAILKDRVYHVAEQELGEVVAAPPFPFLSEDVQPSPEGLSAQEAAYHAYADTGADAYGQQAYDYGSQQQQSYGAPATSYGAGYSQGAYGAPPAAPSQQGYAQQQQQGSQTTTPTYANQTTSYAQASPAQGYANAAPTASYAAANTPAYAQASAPAYTQAPSQQPAYAQQPSAPAYSAPRPAAYTQSASARTYAPAPQQQAAPAAYQPSAPAPQQGGYAQTPAYSAPPPAVAAQPTMFKPTHTAAPAPMQMTPSMMQAPTTAAPPAPLPRAQPPPPPPAAPSDCNVNNVDTSAISAEDRAIVQSLTALYKACEPLGQQSSTRKREMDDNAKRLGTLFWKLNAGQLSTEVVGKLHQLAAAAARGDWQGVHQIQVNLTASHWDECSAWLTACKRLCKARSQMG